MLDLFGSMQGLFKISSVIIDNEMFKIHKCTVIVLIGFSVVVSCRQYIGEPIECIADGIPLHVMNTYCWTTSVFTTGEDVFLDNPGSQNNRTKYYRYYKWVGFACFFQGIMFYLPYYLWKVWEGGRMKVLVMHLNHPDLPMEYIEERKKILVHYIRAYLHRQHFYAFRFLLCEILNFVNAIGQIYLTDVFLDGEFLTYGWDVLRFKLLEPQNQVLFADPGARVFPLLAKCAYRKFGPSGTKQNLDGLCVLPLNEANDKFYALLWFWFVCVAIATGFWLLFELALLSSRSVRANVLSLRAIMVDSREIRSLNARLHFGDWFVLHQLCRNIDPLLFKELIRALAIELNTV